MWRVCRYLEWFSSLEALVWFTLDFEDEVPFEQVRRLKAWMRVAIGAYACWNLSNSHYGLVAGGKIRCSERCSGYSLLGDGWRRTSRAQA